MDYYVLVSWEIEKLKREFFFSFSELSVLFDHIDKIINQK